jgi:phage host-nuclease inhibitor protein Gam
MSKRDQYITAAKNQLDELNQDIDTLETKAADASADARARYRAEVNKLREQTKRVSAQLDELKSAGEDKWEQLAAEVTKVTDAMKHSFNYFKSQV